MQYMEQLCLVKEIPLFVSVCKSHLVVSLSGDPWARLADQSLRVLMARRRFPQVSEFTAKLS